MTQMHRDVCNTAAARLPKLGPSPNFWMSFEAAMWALCVLAAFFLASRVALRLWTKGSLIVNDYVLIAALPMLVTASGLIQSLLNTLCSSGCFMSSESSINKDPKSTRRLIAAIEILWIAIYLVKFCFLVSFKLYTAPYAYANLYLTRYYWLTVGLCTAACLFTLSQPIALCPELTRCRYLSPEKTVSWEVAVTVMDIITDFLIISIPILLIRVANLNRSYGIISNIFKSLSIFAVVVASTRLALQHDTRTHQIVYSSLVPLLFIEAVIAIIMASVSSYRVVILDYLSSKTSEAGPPSPLKAPRTWSTRLVHHKDEDSDSHINDPYLSGPMLGAARMTGSTFSR